VSEHEQLLLFCEEIKQSQNDQFDHIAKFTKRIKQLEGLQSRTEAEK
jgi:hypothetical protein